MVTLPLKEHVQKEAEQKEVIEKELFKLQKRLTSNEFEQLKIIHQKEKEIEEKFAKELEAERYSKI